MLGEYLTNQLQGALFSKFRAEITNLPEDLEMGKIGMDGAGLKRGNCVETA